MGHLQHLIYRAGAGTSHPVTSPETQLLEKGGSKLKHWKHSEKKQEKPEVQTFLCEVIIPVY